MMRISKDSRKRKSYEVEKWKNFLILLKFIKMFEI
jgi:hypothetical protein